MSEYQKELLFDLMESEADVLYFIRDAKKPAIIIISSPVGHFPKKKSDRYTLWFGQGIERDSFKTIKEAESKALAILETAKSQIPVRIEYPRIKKKTTSILVGKKEA